ncbi:7-deoxyloganetic acid glucosyltransferase-like isoform X2 [Castanea sativa]
MLKLAELLGLAGIHVTFLNTDFIHDRLVRYTDIETRFSCYPGFQFKTVSDGLSADHPRSLDKFMELYDSLNSKTKPLLREMLASNQLGSNTRPSLTCIIVDGLISIFTSDIANELQIPIIYFRTISASCFWAFFSVPNIIEAGELPVKGNEDMDHLITTVPGMEGFLRYRDLPSFCRGIDLNHFNLPIFVTETQRSPQAHALILNTFEDLEEPALFHIRTHCSKVYTIGPLHSLLKFQLEAKRSLSQSQSSNSLFEVDRSCMTWLDAQPLKSVIYVSFGSISTMTKDEHMEFWFGLVNSKKRFLWVLRSDAIAGEHDRNEVPIELVEGTKERGYIVSWTPQEEVLDHHAIGGFLTHSGWNSTLESVVAGLPMICWPYFGDQQLNSRFVSEVWKLGLDMKDVCDRFIVEQMVNDLMGERREEFMKSTTKMARLARKSVSEGGSSCCNLDLLVEDIRLMSMGAD